MRTVIALMTLSSLETESENGGKLLAMGTSDFERSAEELLRKRRKEILTFDDESEPRCD
jgi:hypothetical protein